MDSWRTTQGRRQRPLEEHGLATVGAERGGVDKFRRQWLALRSGAGLFKMLLQGKQARSNGCAKEAIVTHFHKASGEHMLEETVHEFFSRERTLLELPGVGGAVLEGDLGRFHAAGVLHPHQAAIAKRHAVDIRCQVAKRGLSVAHRFAMHDPVLLPDLGWNLCKERRFAQQTLEASTE